MPVHDTSGTPVWRWRAPEGNIGPVTALSFLTRVGRDPTFGGFAFLLPTAYIIEQNTNTVNNH
jgi:hypothetical protein